MSPRATVKGSWLILQSPFATQWGPLRTGPPTCDSVDVAPSCPHSPLDKRPMTAPHFLQPLRHSCPPSSAFTPPRPVAFPPHCGRLSRARGLFGRVGSQLCLRGLPPGLRGQCRHPRPGRGKLCPHRRRPRTRGRGAPVRPGVLAPCPAPGPSRTPAGVPVPGAPGCVPGLEAAAPEGTADIPSFGVCPQPGAVKTGTLSCKRSLLWGAGPVGGGVLGRLAR